jgi:hypothetical protein
LNTGKRREPAIRNTNLPCLISQAVHSHVSSELEFLAWSYGTGRFHPPSEESSPSGQPAFSVTDVDLPGQPQVLLVAIFDAPLRQHLHSLNLLDESDCTNHVQLLRAYDSINCRLKTEESRRSQHLPNHVAELRLFVQGFLLERDFFLSFGLEDLHEGRILKASHFQDMQQRNCLNDLDDIDAAFYRAGETDLDDLGETYELSNASYILESTDTTISGVSAMGTDNPFLPSLPDKAGATYLDETYKLSSPIINISDGYVSAVATNSIDFSIRFLSGFTDAWNGGFQNGTCIFDI